MKFLIPAILLFCQLGVVGAQVKIHEVLVDGVGSDGDEVFTELTGPAGFSLDGWVLEAINGGNGSVYRVVSLEGLSFPDDGVLVLATSSALGDVLMARDAIASVDWQNGPDAVRLIDPSGQIVDAIQYGDAGVYNAGEGQSAMVPAAGQSLSRDSLGTDTDNNLRDFHGAEPTPGFAVVLLPSGVTLSLPDTVALPGQQLDLPLRIGDNGAGLLAMEVAVVYDADVLLPVTVVPADSTSQWQFAAHVIQGESMRDTLRIAMATDVDTLRGDAVLLQVRFRVRDQRQPAHPALQLIQAVVDAGGSRVATVDGGIRRIGHGADMEVDVPEFALPHALQLCLVDPDEDRTSMVDTIRVTITEGDTLEQVTLIEDGSTSGSFRGTAVFRHGLVVAGDGVVELSPRRTASLCFTDSLDADGQRSDVCMQLTARGHDGRLRITRVAEPGDTLWLRVEDRDLNRDSLILESTVITIRSTADNQQWQRSLRAINAAKTTYDGYLLSSLQDAGEGRISVAAGDSLIVSYLDTAAAAADSIVRRDTTIIISRFGDADGNGHLQAFDANTILRHVLTPILSVAGSLAANVDSLAPAGAVTPLDASLLLQQRVGMLGRFPVQERLSFNHPGPGVVAGPVARAMLRPVAVSLRVDGDDLLVWMDERDGVLAAFMELVGVDSAGVEGVDVESALPGHISVSAYRGELLRIAMAGATAVPGAGPLLRLRGAARAARVSLQRVIINDGAIVTTLGSSVPLVPGSWDLLPNHPNPFNGTTLIPLRLTQGAYVRAQIINVLGQQVRVLWNGPMSPGTHRFSWDGRDDIGRTTATGFYTARVKVGSVEQSQRLMLLR